MKTLKLKTIITGAGSGLGAATAKYLTNAGADVVIFDQNIEKADEVARSIGGLAIQTDISNEKSVEQAMNQAVEHWQQPPNAVINCAGIGAGSRIIDKEQNLSTDFFEKIIKVNLLGTYLVMSHAIKHMINAPVLDEDSSQGVIINTSSVAAEDGQVGQTAYAASKSGVAALNLPAARELKKFGIRVVSIAPGLFATPLMEKLPEKVREDITRSVPFPPRLGKPEEYARLVEHIITNSYINAINIRLDGGMRLPA